MNKSFDEFISNEIKKSREIDTYIKNNPLFYSTVPSLRTKCPEDYNWNACISSLPECGMECRTCRYYNPLRMLYEEAVYGVEIVVPREVLLHDCRVQLDKG